MRGGAMTKDNGPLLNFCPVAQKKVQFDMEMEKETFFKVNDTLTKDNGKVPIYKISLNFDSTNSLR